MFSPTLSYLFVFRFPEIYESKGLARHNGILHQSEFPMVTNTVYQKNLTKFRFACCTQIFQTFNLAEIHSFSVRFVPVSALPNRLVRFINFLQQSSKHLSDWINGKRANAIDWTKEYEIRYKKEWKKRNRSDVSKIESTSFSKRDFGCF